MSGLKPGDGRLGAAWTLRSTGFSGIATRAGRGFIAIGNGPQDTGTDVNIG